MGMKMNEMQFLPPEHPKSKREETSMCYDVLSAVPRAAFAPAEVTESSQRRCGGKEVFQMEKGQAGFLPTVNDVRKGQPTGCVR